MRRVLIANRGEIALRAIRVCRRLGLESVAVYSSADANSPHRWSADHAICIGPPAPKSSYLSAGALIETAVALKCDAIYPGYGFLAENHAFAERSKEAGLTFIGPDSESIARMGDKVAARQAAAAAGIPIVPGSRQGYTSSGPAKLASADIGFPLLLKASGGGGGRGMRVVERAEDFVAQFEQASAEALAAFGNAEVYLERFFPQVRHIEIQIFGDTHGNYVHLGERDCSVQRRHQKLVEEAPSPALDDATRRQMAEAAVALIRTLKYVNAGTVEFIYDPSSGKFFFIEMNTRIQVEHPVTEMVTGTDLVVEQFRVAAGERLSFGSSFANGRSAIEFRINAEDAARDFRPSPGTLKRWRPPSGREIRIDSHAYENYAVPPYYDSMLAKLIVCGPDRASCIETARSALDRFQVSGVTTTVPFHAHLLRQGEFARAEVHTRWIENNLRTVAN
ncbi:MAG TPA: acetyl-CoA carboxylase biotin carboxylase subunit [Bradyrhizobium sp.]|nr:acetyl-CoA carboxylase biotin carboxylase subunit [Bradyrhizobium sp.]